MEKIKEIDAIAKREERSRSYAIRMAIKSYVQNKLECEGMKNGDLARSP